MQETILAAARQFRERKFDRSRGSFKSWLRNLARWKVQDKFRQRDSRIAELVHRGAEVDGESRLTATFDRLPAESVAPIEEVWEREWREHVVAAAVLRVRERISPRQFQIFECHVIKGWDIAKVCRELGVNRAQVYLAKTRIQPLVRKELRRIERDGIP